MGTPTLPESSSLAPAAGAGIGKLLADRLLADPEFIVLMVDAAKGGLKAMAPRRWDPAAKEWIADPDPRVRMQTLALLLAHMEGEPIKRILHQHVGSKGEIDLHGALQDSPALRDALQRELDKAAWRESGSKGRKVKRADPIEVE